MPAHLDTARLLAASEHLRAAPHDDGQVRMLVRRPAPGERNVCEEAVLDAAEGMIGDTWRARGSRSTPDGRADPAAQITVMSWRVAMLVAGTVGRIPLAGDQIYVDLDLSVDNLPPGSLLAVGGVLLEVSAKPHTGCAKFVDRFGADAMRFVNSAVGRHLRWRGMNARVVGGGTVRVGERAMKVVDEQAV